MAPSSLSTPIRTPALSRSSSVSSLDAPLPEPELFEVVALQAKLRSLATKGEDSLDDETLLLDTKTTPLIYTEELPSIIL
jgi:hypothetical protein